MSNELKVGDLVQLKSGGPTMTIGVIVNGLASCCWFDDWGQSHGREFGVEMLCQVGAPVTGTDAEYLAGTKRLFGEDEYCLEVLRTGRAIETMLRMKEKAWPLVGFRG